MRKQQNFWYRFLFLLFFYGFPFSICTFFNSGFSIISFDLRIILFPGLWFLFVFLFICVQFGFWFFGLTIFIFVFCSFVLNCCVFFCFLFHFDEFRVSLFTRTSSAELQIQRARVGATSQQTASGLRRFVKFSEPFERYLFSTHCHKKDSAKI